MDLGNLPAISHTLALILLYGITGFGPGVAVGVMLANTVAGRDKELMTERYDQKINEASDHNAQWHPAHKRWGKDEEEE